MKSLSHKILFYTIFCSAIIVLLTVTMMFMQSKTSHMYSTRISETESINADIIDVTSHITASQLVIQKLLRLKDIDSLEILIALFDSSSANTKQHLVEIGAGKHEVSLYVDSLETTNREVINHFLQNDASMANFAYMTYSNPRFEQTLSSLRDFRESTIRTFNTTTVRLKKGIDSLATFALLVSLILLGAGIAWGEIFRRSIVKPLAGLIGMLDSIVHGNGDLTQRINVASNDELGKIATLFNTFIEQQQRIIATIASNAATLSTKAGRLSAAAESFAAQAHVIGGESSEVNASADNSVIGITTISSSTEEMSVTIHSIASASEELSVTINEIAKNCVQESTIAAEAATMAKKSHTLITEFGETSRKIRNIIDSINSIADQTKMLALNATIEAASAGEAGKGFAVVAGEVKSLARLTAQSTQEITSQIAAIEDGIENAITASESILSTIDQVSAIATTIASSVEEQSITVNSVSRSISETKSASESIAQSVQNNAEHIKNISTTIKRIDGSLAEQQTLVGTVQEDAWSLARLSSELDAIVKKFKV